MTTFYIFMNDNIRSKATRRRPCIMVYDGRRATKCRGVRVRDGVVRQSTTPCRAIRTHNVHAWVETKVRPVVKIGRRWRAA